MFVGIQQYLWRLSGASGAGYVLGGKRGAVVGAGVTTFFSFVSAKTATTGIWYAAQSVRIGARLSTGGFTPLAFNPRAGWIEKAGGKAGGIGAGAAAAGYLLGSVAGTGVVYGLEKAGLVQEGSTEDVIDLYVGFVTNPISTSVDFATTIYRGAEVLINDPEPSYTIPSNNAAGILTYNEYMTYQMMQGNSPVLNGHVGYLADYTLYTMTHQL